MTKALILIFLISVALGNTELASSGTSTKIVFPSDKTAMPTTNLNRRFPNVIPGAKWIWDSNGSFTSIKDTLVAEHLFWASCTGQITLNVAAYGNWKVYLDGALIKESSAWVIPQNITVDPQCGKHNLTFIVKKTVTNSYAGLKFLVTQDTSDCNECSSNGLWNPRECKCECLNECLDSYEHWMGYPTCNIVCPPRTNSINSLASPRKLQVLTEPNILIAGPRCPMGQYWDKRECQCKCTLQWCEQDEQFEDDPEDECECKPVSR